MFRNLKFLLIILFLFQIDLPQTSPQSAVCLSPISKLSTRAIKKRKSEEKERLARARFLKLLQHPKEVLTKIMLDRQLAGKHKIKLSLRTSMKLELNGESVQFPPEIPVDVFTRIDVRSLWDEGREEMVFDVTYNAWRSPLLKIRYALHWSPLGTLLFLEIDRDYFVKKERLEIVPTLHKIIYEVLSTDVYGLFYVSELSRYSRLFFGTIHPEVIEVTEGKGSVAPVDLEVRFQKVIDRLTDEKKEAFKEKAVLLLANLEAKRWGDEFQQSWLSSGPKNAKNSSNGKIRRNLRNKFFYKLAEAKRKEKKDSLRYIALTKVESFYKALFPFAAMIMEGNLHRGRFYRLLQNKMSKNGVKRILPGTQIDELTLWMNNIRADKKPAKKRKQETNSLRDWRASSRLFQLISQSSFNNSL